MNDTPVDLPKGHRLPTPLPIGRMYRNLQNANPARSGFGRPIKKASRVGLFHLNKTGHRKNKGK